MNEVELVRRIGAEVPEPDDMTRSRAFRRLQAAISPPEEFARPSTHPRRRRWPVAVAAAVAILMALVWPILDVNQPGARVSAASEFLDEMAKVAEIAPYEEPLQGSFVYTRSKSIRLAYGGTEAIGWATVVPVTRELWVAEDGSGRLREVWGTPTFLTERDREAWVAVGEPALEGPFTSDEAFPEGALHYVDLSDVPADPVELRSLLERRIIMGGPPGDSETFTIIGDLLRLASAPPDVRGALFHVAADLEAAELIGETTDGSGRPGIAVGYWEDDVRHDLIFDPDTTQLLGERTVDLRGTIASWSVYFTSGVVGSTDQRP